MLSGEAASRYRRAPGGVSLMRRSVGGGAGSALVVPGGNGVGRAIARSGRLDDFGSGRGAPAGLRVRRWGALAAGREGGGVSAQVWVPVEGVAAGGHGVEFVEEAGERVGPWKGGRPTS